MAQTQAAPAKGKSNRPRNIALIAAATFLLITAFVGYRIILPELVIKPAGGVMTGDSSMDSDHGYSTEMVERNMGGTAPRDGGGQPPADAESIQFPTAEAARAGTGSLTNISDTGSQPSWNPGGNTTSGETRELKGRVVIHNAAMDVTVTDIQETMDSILRMATVSGGWLVSSSQAESRSGTITVRVPSGMLEQVMNTIRGAALEVRNTSIDSQDVTDEYVDLRAQLTNEENILTTLHGMMEELENPEQVLKVYEQVQQVQGRVEKTKGRIKLIEETSAFSLLTVRMELAPAAIRVDAGEDISTTNADPVKLNAVFQAPAGIEVFDVRWDFGDGDMPAHTQTTIPLAEPGMRATATISHRYDDHITSPHIATVDITGSGPSGQVVGSDQLRVTVIPEPVIRINPGENSQQADTGDRATLTGSFTRPRSLRNVQYEWDPGDGSEPIRGRVAEGKTRAAIEHIYRDAGSYRINLAIIAETEAGEMRREETATMYVNDKPGYVAGGIDIGNAVRNGSRGLTWTLKSLLVLGIWTIIFSPLWGPVAAFVWHRRRSGNRRAAELARPAEPDQQE